MGSDYIRDVRINAHSAICTNQRTFGWEGSTYKHNLPHLRGPISQDYTKYTYSTIVNVNTPESNWAPLYNQSTCREKDRFSVSNPRPSGDMCNTQFYSI